MFVLIGAASCEGDLFDEMFNGSGNFNQNNGGSGNNGENDNKQNTIKLTNANACYYGNYYNESTENIMIDLSEGTIGSDGYFTGKATVLSIDLLQAKGNGATLAEGTYNCNSTYKSGTFVPGYTSGEGDEAFDNGTTLYIQKSDTDYNSYFVTAGSVTIQKKSNGVYSISATVKANNTEYKLSYEGAITITDKSGGEVIEDDDEANFPGSANYDMKATALYNGSLYKGYDDYTLLIYCGEYGSDGNFVSKGYEIAFDLITTQGDGKSIPVGTYKCTSSDFTAFHFLDGLEEDNNIYPSYFYKQFSKKSGDSSIELITDGSGTISYENGKYGAKFYFKTSKNGYLIYYSGVIDFRDNRTITQQSVLKEIKGRRLNGIPTKISSERSGLSHRSGRSPEGIRTLIKE